MNRTRLGSWLTEVRRRIGILLSEHTTLSLTVLYLFLTVIGATHEFFLYARFKVNILQFADPLDFLLAAIRQPLVVLFCLLPLVLLALIEGVGQWLRPRALWYRRMAERQEARAGYAKLQSVSYVVFVVVYFVLFTLLLSKASAQRLREGKGRRVSIRLNQPDPAAPTLDGVLLGTTSRYVLVYQQADSSTHVVPVGSMVEMRILQRPAGR